MITALCVVGLVVGARDRANRAAHIPLYSEGVALDASGKVVAVPTGSTPLYYSGTRVLDDGSAASQRLADAQRAWLAAGTVPGADGPYADMVTDALLDLHTLQLDDGASVAAWSPQWRYVWPRDASFVAVAFARTGHTQDALDILDFLARVQEDDGGFEARYLPDGSGSPDDRTRQTDGIGWVMWAATEVVDSGGSAAERTRLARHLRPLVDKAAARAEELVAGDGLPPASPDYWEVGEKKLTLGTIAPLLAGLESAARLYDELGDTDDQRRAASAARLTRDALEDDFGDGGPLSAYGRYAQGQQADAASAFTLVPFQPTALAGAKDAWEASIPTMRRPAGGLAPGAGWKRDGISWTPQTALYALAAAANGEPDQATGWLDWLDAHRTDAGAIPEKVLADGSPAAVAPLAWSAALVVLAVGTLETDAAAAP